jgi:chlorobactene glucosyltransferase
MNTWKPAAWLTLLALPLGLRADRMYRVMPRLRPQTTDGRPQPTDVFPSLSIIVPARNESANLKLLLPTLNALQYPGALEIIVVDDHSADDTRAVAESFGARVLGVETLPEGWHGKPHACHLGAQAAHGDWLLFTDADTLHDADSAARAVAFARDHALDGLTLFLRQQVNGWFDGIVLTTAFAGLFAGVRRTHDLMNGQYILLRRSVYAQSGGFAAVRDQALEDLALAAHLRKLNYAVIALRGESAAAVRMYDSTAQMWRGMTRLGAGSLKFFGAGSVLTALFTTALMSPLLVFVGALTRRLPFAWLPITWLASSASVIPFARRFGSAWWALLAPCGALFVLLAAWWGIFSRVIGRGIHWRGRNV